ncbi:uncharacterized protein [Antedon mediterranea]|uniref:uncharacterized protein n=1 Tax=Antedon mediterranea TaxID=105859 RepID=UPI003AF63A5D
MGCGSSSPGNVKTMHVSEKKKEFVLSRFVRLRFKEEVSHEDIADKLCELVGEQARTFKIETEKPGVYTVEITVKTGNEEEQDMFVATATKKIEDARGLSLKGGDKIMGAKEFSVAGDL